MSDDWNHVPFGSLHDDSVTKEKGKGKICWKERKKERDGILKAIEALGMPS